MNLREFPFLVGDKVAVEVVGSSDRYHVVIEAIGEDGVTGIETSHNWTAKRNEPGGIVTTRFFLWSAIAQVSTFVVIPPPAKKGLFRRG